MDWKTDIKGALGAGIDEDVLEELAQHAAATYASARAEGLDGGQAEARVTQEIHAWAANPALLRRRPARAPSIEPPAGAASPAAAILQDTRYAWRLLRRQPAYAALVIATMALGIAATTVLGSVAYGVLLKPLPWADAPRLVRLYETRQGSTRRFRPMITNGTYLPWRDASSTLDAIGAWSVDNVTVPGGAAERIKIASVTPSLLPMLRAAPALGRAFAAGDEEPGRPPLILLSYGFWQRRLGGRADVVGEPLRLETATYSIVGVMPASFAFPDRDTSAWIPFYVPPVTSPSQKGNFSIAMFQALGRLREGSTPAQAAAEGTARGRTAPAHTPVAMAVFGSDGPAEVTAVPLIEALTGEVRPAILILFAAVALLLATATANVASLQLARAGSRRRELAIRAALGAGRARLVRQTLVENLLLGLLGGAAGLVLAALMHRALPSVLPADFPRLDDLAFDIRIQVFALAVSMVAGLGCGLLPAVEVASPDLVPALAEDARAPVGGGLRSRTARARAVIMAGQVAVASVLLVGALLLGRSFLGMMHADLGYDAASVLSARVVLADGEYSPERRHQTMAAIVQRLGTVTGVEHAAFSSSMPFTGGTMLSSSPLIKRDGSRIQIQTSVREVSPGYFAAVGQKILEGREFTAEDRPAAQIVAIVNQEFSRRYLEGRAFGWTLYDAMSPRPIVGVAEDAARQSVTDTPQPEVYFAAGQRPLHTGDLYVVARAAGDPHALVPALREIVRGAAAGAPLESIMTLEDRVAATLARPRLYAVLLGTFAAFALAIAGVGLFGVLSYTVAQRAREIGVRSALGAQMRDIIGLVLGQSMAIAGTGIAAGLVASYWLTGALQRFLYGVTPHDAVSFGAVAAVLLVVSALATIVPARRAAGVDPVKVLRA